MLRCTSMFSALLLAGSAQAALVTVQFSSTMNYLDFEEAGGPSRFVDEVDLGTFTIRKGETVTGRYTYEDSTPLEMYQVGDNIGHGADNIGTYTITFEGSGTTIRMTDTDLDTYRSASGDGFVLQGETGTGESGSPYFYSGLSLSAPAGTHDPATLPGAGVLSSYDLAHSFAHSVWMAVGGLGVDRSYIWVYPSNTTVQVISSVPEPATYGMLAAGFGIIGIAARRKKSPAA